MCIPGVFWLIDKRADSFDITSRVIGWTFLQIIGGKKSFVSVENSVEGNTSCLHAQNCLLSIKVGGHGSIRILAH